MHLTRSIPVAVLVLTSLPASGQSLSRVSTTPSGAETTGTLLQTSTGPALSADGTRIAFEGAPGIVPGGQGVYVKDRVTGAVTCASVVLGSSNGAPASDVALSADGNVVAFSSDSSALVAGDSNSLRDVFVRDLATSTTTRVSVANGGVQALGGSWGSHYPSMSADGMRIAFVSDCGGLAFGDVNAPGTYRDVFVHDRANGTTQLVSAVTGGTSGPGSSYYPVISPDGRVVAFECEIDLDPSAPGPTPAIFVRDLPLGTTRRASFNAAGAPAIGSFRSLTADFERVGGLSETGRFLTYLIANDVLVRRDLFQGTLATVSLDASQVARDGTGGRMSRDGRFVAFDSRAFLTADDQHSDLDAYVRDMQAGITRRISVEMHGHVASMFQPAGNSAISADGSVVVFESESGEYVPGDTNTHWDVFAVRDVAQGPYCSAGTSSSGCVATLSTSGSASASAGAGFTVSASTCAGQQNGIWLYGASGRSAAPWGSSTMCVAAPRQRMGLQSSGGTYGLCDGAMSVDWNAFVASTPGALAMPLAGLTPIFIQLWMRDPPSATHVVLSDAVEFWALP